MKVCTKGGPGLRHMSVGFAEVGESSKVVVSGDGVGVDANFVLNGSLVAVDIVLLCGDSNKDHMRRVG